MNQYARQLRYAMEFLAERGATFLGQAVRYPGTAMFETLADVPMEQRVELPVFENTQLGLCTGIALAGGLPVSIFPRINFLLEATSQLVQHLDKLPIYSAYRPRVIIRTAVATSVPLDPGPQHLGNYAPALRLMLQTVRVVELIESEMIVPEYLAAADRDGSTLLVEFSEKYA